MEQTAVPGRIEVPVAEARSRLAQLIRMISVTGQVVVVLDGGRAAAAIVPADAAQSRAEAAAVRERARAAAAGWARRIEEVRGTVGRQQADRIRVLESLLDEAWGLLDARCPPGADRAVEGARAAYRQVRSAGQT
jgi:antitoxin (DNA-binding transcriptional repressor) of toxin-antitoxin stability system